MASTGLEAIARMEYPGRLIVVGTLPGGNDVVGYAVTGRSASSQARRLVVGDDGNVYTKPTDPEALRRGNPALLVYPAIMFYRDSIAVSNGAQTRLVYEELIRTADGAPHPAEVLVRAFRAPAMVAGIDVTRYEPDEPSFTPRISGCVTAKGAALCIAKRGESDHSIKQFFEVPLVCAGRAKVVATYTGANVDPLPSFVGEPVDVQVTSTSAEDFAESLYAALGPKDGGPDFRVAVAVVERSQRGIGEVQIVNRADR